MPRCALLAMPGNHETMNVAGRFTYATQPAMAEFLEWHALSRLDANLRVSLTQQYMLFIHLNPLHYLSSPLPPGATCQAVYAVVVLFRVLRAGG
jgi:hypothetical protein